MHYHWTNAPEAVRVQVDVITSDIHRVIGSDNLVGIYLHGSLAMGCFNPESSDIDILAVTRTGLNSVEKRKLLTRLSAESMRPRFVELSVVQLGVLVPWHFPTPFELHWSEYWRIHYEQTDLQYHQLPDTDIDLAAHITVIHDRGIVLHGRPIPQVFPTVPRADYLTAIMDDVTDALASIHQNPVYAVLNTCRVLAYLSEHHVLSKDEGGEWALNQVPGSLRSTVETALNQYRSFRDSAWFSSHELDRFVAFAQEQLAVLRLSSQDRFNTSSFSFRKSTLHNKLGERR